MTAFTQEYLPLISDYLWVLSTCTKGFTHKYLPLVGYYSQVQNCTTRVTREYFQLINNRLWAVYSSFRMSPTHELSSNVSRHDILHMFVCKLGRKLYHIANGMYKGVGGGWEAKGRLRLPLRHRQQYCVSSKWHKQSQSTGRLRQSLAAVWHHTHHY